MSVFRQLAKSVLTSCVPRHRLLVRGPKSHGPRPRMALTFDDGPHPDHTPRLLSKLNELAAKATFFVVGKNVEQYPDLIRLIAEAGHEVANHTYSHSEPSQTSTSAFLEEVRNTDTLLRNLTGRDSTTVRPPKGELNWMKLCGLWRAQKTVALWNVDPKDFQMQSLEQMNQWCASYVPKDGDIVLMHDTHPYAVRAVETIAERGIFERFELTTIGQWMGRTKS